eukprot:333544_1
MAEISGPFADKCEIKHFKQQSVSHFRRVQLIQWKFINGFTMAAMDQFQLEDTFEKTVNEIKIHQPKLFKNTKTNCLIYRETDPKTIMENDTQYQFWMMQNPTVLYFQAIEPKGGSSCCIIL